jgi:hypothetical protein
MHDSSRRRGRGGSIEFKIGIEIPMRAHTHHVVRGKLHQLSREPRAPTSIIVWSYVRGC